MGRKRARFLEGRAMKKGRRLFLSAVPLFLLSACFPPRDPAVLYNPADEWAQKDLELPFDCTGLTDAALIGERKNSYRTYKIDRNYKVRLSLRIAPRRPDLVRHQFPGPLINFKGRYFRRKKFGRDSDHCANQKAAPSVLWL
jgi:hypothetical protein